MSEAKRSYWGIGIGLFYTVFVIFLLSVVVYSKTQTPELVHQDYYASQVAYQDEIDAAKRTVALQEPPAIRYRRSDRSLQLYVPAAIRQQASDIQLEFYRPSASAQDMKIDVAKDAKHPFLIDASQLSRGMWKVNVRWRQGDLPYSYATRLVIP